MELAAEDASTFHSSNERAPVFAPRNLPSRRSIGEAIGVGEIGRTLMEQAALLVDLDRVPTELGHDNRFRIPRCPRLEQPEAFGVFSFLTALSQEVEPETDSQGRKVSLDPVADGLTKPILVQPSRHRAKGANSRQHHYILQIICYL